MGSQEECHKEDIKLIFECEKLRIKDICQVVGTIMVSNRDQKKKVYVTGRYSQKIKGTGELRKVGQTMPQDKIILDSANKIALSFPNRVSQAAKMPQLGIGSTLTGWSVTIKHLRNKTNLGAM